MHTRVWEPQHWSIKESGGGVAQSPSHVWLFATPWTAACQDSLLFTVSGTLLRFLSTESVVLSNHLILCHPLLLLPSIFPSIRVFSSELALEKKHRTDSASWPSEGPNPTDTLISDCQPSELWENFSSACSVTKSCLTLWGPVDYRQSGSSVHGILKQEYWSW